MAMFGKNVSCKLLNSFTRRSANSAFSSSTVASSRSAGKTNNNRVLPIANATTTTSNDGEKIFNLDDTKTLFTGVPTRKLINSSATLNVVAVEPVVDFCLWVMNSRLMKVGLFRDAVMGTIKRTAYNHFVAGSDVDETGRTVRRLWDCGLRGMLDFGVEHAVDNKSCDENTEELLKTAESTQSLPSSSVSFVVVKVTATCPVYLLRRVSDLLRWEHKNSSFKLPWKQQTLPIFSETSPFYHTLEQPAPLSADEEHDLELAHQRLMKVCEKSFECNVPVVIDAEDTSIQPAIDYMTYWACIKYNETQRPIIYGTIQGYLKDAHERMCMTKKAADKMGMPMGFKLVRGAYMSSERKLANELGFESPIHETLNDTHNCYNNCATFMLDEIHNRPGGLILATHNLNTGKLIARKAHELGITKDSERLEFASLYGMADAMTFGLRNAGFGVSKYLPFGPVDQIMPYLLRRAEENKGLLSSSNLDRKLMMKELKRRVKASLGLEANESENQLKANSITS